MFRKAIYLTQEAFRTISRHKGMTSISVIIMSLSLLMLAVFLLATDNILRFVGEAQRDMKVYAYLDDGVTTAGVEKLRSEITEMPEVERVVFISKHEALADFRVQLGADADLLDALDANPLPNSFWITPKREHRTGKSMGALASRIATLGGVEDVRYGEEFLARFASIVNGIYYVDLVVGLIVIISAIFIISNAVRLTVISRAKNIEVLKLVGATNRFITMPFVIEGAAQGGFAAMVSLLMLYAITLLTRRFIPDVSFFGADKALLFMFTCVLIGSAGSVMALRRFRKI